MTAESKRDRRAQALAGLALSRAMAGDWPKATGLAQQIGDECGPAGVDVALRAWIDTLSRRMGHKPGQRIRIVLQEVETATVRLPDDEQVRPEVQWAARLIEARAASDLDAWTALMREVPEGPTEFGKRVGAVLETVAMQLARMSRAALKGGAL